MIEKRMNIKILVVFILFFAVIVFGQSALAKDKVGTDLSGCWIVNMYYVYSDGNSGFEENRVIIKWANTNRYWGYVCDLDVTEEGRYFSAVVDGQDVYITHWDSITKATLEKEGNLLTGINQSFDADPRSSKTSLVTAIRNLESECLANCFSCKNGEKDGIETDVDCGGSCKPCVEGDDCEVNADCQSGLCLSNKCIAPVCGDGYQSPGEECDDGGDTASCDADCTLAVCGDSYINTAAGEECDPPGDGCSFFCTYPVCGNAIVEWGEECDDGNTGGGDGCSSSCLVE